MNAEQLGVCAATIEPVDQRPADQPALWTWFRELSHQACRHIGWVVAAS
jgi:hypothetical protein